jgi:hypothetical protein
MAERQKKAEEKKAALATRIASKAATRLARAAAHRPKVIHHGLHRNIKSKNKQLQRPRKVQDAGDINMVKSRPSLPRADISSSGRLIKSSKKLQQQVVHVHTKHIKAMIHCKTYRPSTTDAYDMRQ